MLWNRIFVLHLNFSVLNLSIYCKLFATIAIVSLLLYILYVFRGVLKYCKLNLCSVFIHFLLLYWRSSKRYSDMFSFAECPKLEAVQNKQASNIGRRDYLANTAADYWARSFIIAPDVVCDPRSRYNISISSYMIESVYTLLVDLNHLFL